MVLNPVDFARYPAFQGTLGNVWRYFWLSQLENTNGIWWVEAKDAAQHPTKHRIVPDNKELCGPKCNSAGIENFWLKAILTIDTPNYPFRASSLLVSHYNSQNSQLRLLPRMQGKHWKWKIEKKAKRENKKGNVKEICKAGRRKYWKQNPTMCYLWGTHIKHRNT